MHKRKLDEHERKSVGQRLMFLYLKTFFTLKIMILK